MVGVALGAAAIGAAGSLAGAGMSAAASKSANAANQKMMQQLWAISQQQNKPYQQLGKGAANMYGQMLPQWLSQAQYQPFTNAMYQQSPLYTPMVNNLAELQATPGYQFQLQQGQQALGQTAAATGGLLSGAQQKAANNYAQNQASTGFQAAWQRAQTAYQNAFNTYNQQYANTLAGIGNQQSGLQSAISTGYNAANAPTNTAAGVAGSAMQSNTNAGNQRGNMYGTIGSTLGNLGGYGYDQFGSTAVPTGYNQNYLPPV
jgi:hypothetical protein